MIRLLHIHTLEFNNFERGYVPAYAIASHRWQGSETTYEDFIRDPWKDCRAHSKILDFCAYMLDHADDLSRLYGEKLNWLWIDTCCIDQRNSNELSEAINSMYDWYASSHVCLVYLFDAERQDPIATSGWFTRGWTLQELLAPSLVVFLDKDWQIIGVKQDKASRTGGTSSFNSDGRSKTRESSTTSYKESSGSTDALVYNPLLNDTLTEANRTVSILNAQVTVMINPFADDTVHEYLRQDGIINEEISAATGIPDNILSDLSSIRMARFDEILWWMRPRSTLHWEDQAYCLLGLMDVSMPLNYGEHEKSIIRLLEQVRDQYCQRIRDMERGWHSSGKSVEALREEIHSMDELVSKWHQQRAHRRVNDRNKGLEQRRAFAESVSATSAELDDVLYRRTLSRSSVTRISYTSRHTSMACLLGTATRHGYDRTTVPLASLLCSSADSDGESEEGTDSEDEETDSEDEQEINAKDEEEMDARDEEETPGPSEHSVEPGQETEYDEVDDFWSLFTRFYKSRNEQEVDSSK